VTEGASNAGARRCGRLCNHPRSVRLYDLSVNKHAPIGERKVSKKAKLTHISFNPNEPILLVGDDAGLVVCLKLSANLRKMSSATIADLNPQTEHDKLDKTLLLHLTAVSATHMVCVASRQCPEQSAQEAGAAAKAAAAHAAKPVEAASLEVKVDDGDE
jgi:hypothetical protein